MTAPPPRTVRVGPHRCTIRIDKTAHNIAQASAEATLYGHYDPGTNLITIAPDLHRDAEADTVLHEILHALITGTGLTSTGGALDDHDRAEVVVAALAPALLELLRRNPKLIDYLTG